jgi:UDP:flavonoid glycosyltransferase YjiC (YdhE family)
LITLGSFGDLHPYLAMGRAIVRGGGRATVATHQQYRAQVEAAGLTFAAIPPSEAEMPMDEAWAIRANAPVRGIEFVVKSMVLPHFEALERRIFEIAPGHDLLVSHFLAMAAPAVAEVLGVPWLSCAYSPATLFSAYDPPALGVLPFLPSLKRLGPKALRSLYRGLAVPSQGWFGKLHEQRARLGLAALETNPLFQYFSPRGTLALFPEKFATPQPDWPPHTVQVGFPLHDEPGAQVSTAARTFCEAGSPPIVCTLGTSVSLMKTQFFDVARAAVTRLGRRAIFVIGPNPPPEYASLRADERVFVTRYEPYPDLFARAHVIVHQGGINTTARALASDRPQVVVPFANDQLDNAARVARMGAGVNLPARKLSTSRLAAAIRRSVGLRAPEGLSQVSGFDERLFAAVTGIAMGAVAL